MGKKILPKLKEVVFSPVSTSPLRNHFSPPFSLPLPASSLICSKGGQFQKGCCEDLFWLLRRALTPGQMVVHLRTAFPPGVKTVVELPYPSFHFPFHSLSRTHSPSPTILLLFVFTILLTHMHTLSLFPLSFFSFFCPFFL